MEVIDFELLIRILVAHLLSDFFFQPKLWVEKKDKYGLHTKYLYLHIALTAIVLMIIIWDLDLYLVVLWITGAHFIIDALKSVILKPTQKSKNSNSMIFLADQLLHFIVILLVWLCYTHQFQEFNNIIHLVMIQPKSWLTIFFILLLTIPSSVLIGKFTQKWSAEIGNDAQINNSGLKDAGKWIGIIERLIIFTLILVDEISIIGFLLAAKSVFRFCDLKGNSDQKRTEYIIIGTFLSFALAIISGLIYRLIII